MHGITGKSSSFRSDNVSFMVMEGLENRRLLTINPTLGGLIVTGTSAADKIIIKMDADGERVRVAIDGVDQGPFEPSTDEQWEIRVDGKAGDDEIVVDETDGTFVYRVVMEGGKGNDTLTGGTNEDFFLGQSGNDLLSSGGADDTTLGEYLFGHSGDDTLIGATGIDRFFGGPGGDTLDDVGPEDVINPRAGDTINGDAFQRATINGTAGDDEILVTVSDDGDSVVISINGVEEAPLVNSRALELLVLGGAGSDTIEMQDTSGNPLLANEVRLRGGDGSDTITGGAVRVLIHGEAGDDVLTGSTAADRIFGSEGADEINGLAGEDHLEGNGDDDVIAGGDDDDEMFGGKGDDNLNGNGGNDVFRGGTGNDTLAGGIGNDGLFGGHGEDELTGGAGNDTLKGAYDADDLFGGDGDDLLIGGLNKGLNDPGDNLDGGDGEDTLQGLEGGDVIE